MDVANVRVIPFPGKPLEFEIPGAQRTFFSAPERGFLIGPENFALEPVVRWAVEDNAPPGAMPLTFFGPSGCGKTHLLQGIEEAWRKEQHGNGKKKRGLYLKATDFARLFATAIETRTVDDFRRRYREATLLLIDDLAAISEKPFAQEELLFTTEFLLTHGRTVVFADSRFPSESRRYSERLATRLLGGTTVPVSLPGAAVRLRFLRELTLALRTMLPTAALEFAARELPLAIPALNGLFTQMFFEAKVNGTKLDMAFVKDYLTNRIIADRPTVAEIAQKTAKHFSLKLSDLRGRSRSKTVATARAVAVYLAREKTGLSLKEIGKYFDRRDHTTIRHLADSIETALATDRLLRDAVVRLQ